MRLILVSLAFASTVFAGEPMCGTAPANEARVRALHARTAVSAVDGNRAATLREGAFYLQTDPTITPGHRPFDLHGQSLVFTPAGPDAFRMRREALQYIEPAGAPVRDFTDATYDGWYFVEQELPFAFPLFGTNVTRIYVDAFNGIRTSDPRIQRGTQFDAIQASVHRGPLLSPLMVTAGARAPRPRLWIDRRSDAVTLTWRSSSETNPLAYDVQARLAKNGTVTYSYRSMAGIHWGSPILSSGLDPATVTRATVVTADDKPDDASQSAPDAVRPMLDVQRVDVQRLGNSDLFAIRITVKEAIDRTKLDYGESLELEVRLSFLEVAAVRIDRFYTDVFSFTSRNWDFSGEAAHVDGNVVEIYGVERAAGEKSIRVATSFGSGVVDTLSLDAVLPAAPRSIVTDLSSVAQNALLDLPIAEPFVLGELDPHRVWGIVQTAYGLRDDEYDAVAIYQTFFTDLIFYAGAYATGGNPRVDGIRPFTPWYGTHAVEAPTLLHMNQLTWGYGRSEESASQVLLHEFGHRWLYFFSIVENGFLSNALNPATPHPAAYVHTPAAFPVYGEHESSVMGGGYFTPQPDGSHVAHAANMGYSWTDLYLMGLAAPEEVPPWFYLAGTYLPLEYWPPEGAVVNGEKREVRFEQITAAHGPRKPSAALSQRQFRVLFVLVTNDAAPAEAEVAKLNEWRRVMERNFARATGGRGRLITTFTRPGKRRAL